MGYSFTTLSIQTFASKNENLFDNLIIHPQKPLLGSFHRDRSYNFLGLKLERLRNFPTSFDKNQRHLVSASCILHTAYCSMYARQSYVTSFKN